MLNDPIYNWKSSSLPTALVLPSSLQDYPEILSGVIGIALDTPSPLEISAGSHASVVATSSTFSFETNRIRATLGLFPQNNLPHIANGSFPVAAAESIGSGTVFVIGDSLFFTNPIWNIADNRILVTNMLNDSTNYLLTSNWPQNTIAPFKASISSAYSVMSGFPQRYLFAIGFVGVGLALLPVFSGIREETERSEKMGSSEKERMTNEFSKRLEKIGKSGERTKGQMHTC